MDYQIRVLEPVGAEDYPSPLGVGSEASEKEGEEAGGRPPLSFCWLLLLVAAFQELPSVPSGTLGLACLGLV